MAGIELERVSKVYPDGTRAVTDLSIDVMDGEFLVVVGPSGCGKTTALRMIAGLEKISDGEVRIDGEVVNTVPARDRDVAMVFQSYALYPHLTVFDNIAFGLTLRKTPRDVVERRVREVAEVLELGEHLRRKPRHLSGGQRQRVAMGRAIVREPRAFLMDEPLSNLDAKLRGQMRAQIARIQRDLGVTTVYVTHDQTEAMTLGDRVAVMRAGVLQQIASPQQLYDEPVDMSVAGFIGSPAMNMVVAGFDLDDAGRAAVSFGGHRLAVPEIVLRRRPALAGYAGRRLVLGIRPEDMDDAALVDGPDGSTLDSVADLVEAMGADVMVHFPIDAEQARSEEHETLDRESGRVRAPGGGALLVGRFSPRVRIFEGQPITVRVDTEGLHFFDIDTGRSIRR
ncbi:carbohydrate ABC transporter ATP-binding protein (CUT1 family) [Pseudonocardia hierapolitana]|uniref:Carbohydrate ABC transporter ATP-binding protein (CUT1 family) n=1 Tax=Pseudonocardia hierapolitana TaxID=1128676 RepID=A0A561SX15_9PSEU|nr:ATP-binding cassette domain-containing protein [Pseudonocardia hierapolitana]TWF79406.1 carbohydrate ABC transporter ATP-binding protein (CUT1 family) [Pseudonocardia hierapolitana]